MNNPYSQNSQQDRESNRGGRNERWDADDHRGSQTWRDDNFNRTQNRPAWGEQHGAYGLQRPAQNVYGDTGYGRGWQGGDDFDEDYRGDFPEQQRNAQRNPGYQNYGGQEQRSQNLPYRAEQQRWERRAERDWQQPWFGNSQASADNYGYARGGYQSTGYQSSAGEQSFQGSNFGAQQTNHRGKGPKGYMRTDERIREEICECLSDAPNIDASEITVEVKDGVVTLEGSVQERAQKHRVEDIADRCSGVKDVNNSLRVIRQAGQQTQDSEKGQEKLTGKSH